MSQRCPAIKVRPEPGAVGSDAHVLTRAEKDDVDQRRAKRLNHVQAAITKHHVHGG